MKVLVIVTYEAKAPGRSGKYHLTAKEDVRQATLRNCEKLRAKVARRAEVKDALLNKPFASIAAAKDAAMKAGFNGHTVQEIAARSRSLVWQ